MAETAVYRKAKQDLQDKCQGLDVNSQTIVTVLRFAMEIVELTDVKGAAQKTMALQLVRDFVRVAPISSDQKAHLEALCAENGPLSNTVDLVIAGTKGELDINKVVQTTASCAVACLPFCMSLCKKK